MDTPCVLSVTSSDGDDVYQIGVLGKSGFIRTTEGYLSRGTSYPLTVNDWEGNNVFYIYSNTAPLTINGVGKVTIRKFLLYRNGRYSYYDTAAISLSEDLDVTIIRPEIPAASKAGRTFAKGTGIGESEAAQASPRTGDRDNDVMLWLILLAASAAGIAAAFKARQGKGKT